MVNIYSKHNMLKFSAIKYFSSYYFVYFPFDCTMIEFDIDIYDMGR